MIKLIAFCGLVLAFFYVGTVMRRRKIDREELSSERKKHFVEKSLR